MGKWNSRYSQRRYDHRRYMFQETTYYPEIDGPESSPDNVPSWEKEFCASIGCVSWRKLIFTRKCMFGHDGVLKWDDAAGEEAFQNAKNRFWAKINGLQCQISLPDPDIYIEKVNWNPQIDAELIMEVDRAYFNPAVSEEATELNDNVSSNGNPWKRKNMESEGKNLKCEAWGTRQAATSTNELEDNPWEQRITDGSHHTKWQKWRSSSVNNSQNDANPNPWEKGNNQGGDQGSYSRDWNRRRWRNLCHNPDAEQGERNLTQKRRFSEGGRWGCQLRESRRNWNDGCTKRGGV
ncbi:hypothetical protein SAY87_032224 [Trapa incisa]|uniref:Uncharacterized protein n=1 Tax=Trapa incisa TaxID=236973 RepID=A0AAN7QLM6_9MYRT|nr:hypothetical protein SAY87_032224 [Trapa incisa]